MPCESRVRSSKVPIDPPGGQELTSPAANLVPRIGLMAFDAVGEVRYLVGAIVDGKGPCGILEIAVGGVQGRMLEAHDALEAQLF
jgi:hypothetical protein